MGSRRAAVGAVSIREQSRTDSEQYLRRLNAGLERQARLIGQSLHDEAGQLLTAAYIALAEAARDLPEPAGERLLVVRRHLAAVEEHLRHVAHELRPRVLDDRGLVSALEVLAQGFETRYGIPTTVQAAVTRRLPGPVEIALYRVVQEALTNIGKHARATRASIRVATPTRALKCTIRDDGVGIDPSVRRRSAGLGLHGMCERLTLLGGTLVIKSARHAGTVLLATVPLEG
jgi:signal transduction histidine kinase